VTTIAISFPTLRILMMVNRDYGEREHAPAVQTLVVSFYS